MGRGGEALRQVWSVRTGVEHRTCQASARATLPGGQGESRDFGSETRTMGGVQGVGLRDPAVDARAVAQGITGTVETGCASTALPYLQNTI